MNITFPHMGNAYIAAKAMFDYLGIDVIVPPPCSKKTLELGTKHSPELACLPLKINMGNYIESIEKGADTVIIIGSCGPCRFGYYGIVQEEILRDLGYDIDVIILDAPRVGLMTLMNRIKKVMGNRSCLSIIKAINKGYRVCHKLDVLEQLALYTRPRELTKGISDAIISKCRREVLTTNSPDNMLNIIDEGIKQLESIPMDTEIIPVKIGIVGEIYTIIEPFVNLNIEQKLGHMGVEVHRSLTISKWLSEHIIMQPLGIDKEKHVKEAAKPYLGLCVGGHGRETIGNTILYSKKNYDGVIQLMPFTCMPEIVAEAILPTVEKDYNIPVLSLILDELTGEAGYITRLEAFVDLIKRKKEREDTEYEWILPGS